MRSADAALLTSLARKKFGDSEHPPSQDSQFGPIQTLVRSLPENDVPSGHASLFSPIKNVLSSTKAYLTGPSAITEMISSYQARNAGSILCLPLAGVASDTCVLSHTGECDTKSGPSKLLVPFDLTKEGCQALRSFCPSHVGVVRNLQGLPSHLMVATCSDATDWKNPDLGVASVPASDGIQGSDGGPSVYQEFEKHWAGSSEERAKTGKTRMTLTDGTELILLDGAFGGQKGSP